MSSKVNSITTITCLEMRDYDKKSRFCFLIFLNADTAVKIHTCTQSLSREEKKHRHRTVF